MFFTKSLICLWINNFISLSSRQIWKNNKQIDKQKQLLPEKDLAEGWREADGSKCRVLKPWVWGLRAPSRLSVHPDPTHLDWSIYVLRSLSCPTAAATQPSFSSGPLLCLPAFLLLPTQPSPGPKTCLTYTHYFWSSLGACPASLACGVNSLSHLFVSVSTSQPL